MNVFVQRCVRLLFSYIFCAFGAVDIRWQIRYFMAFMDGNLLFFVLSFSVLISSSQVYFSRELSYRHGLPAIFY